MRWYTCECSRVVKPIKHFFGQFTAFVKPVILRPATGFFTHLPDSDMSCMSLNTMQVKEAVETQGFDIAIQCTIYDILGNKQVPQFSTAIACSIQSVEKKALRIVEKGMVGLSTCPSLYIGRAGALPLAKALLYTSLQLPFNWARVDSFFPFSAQTREMSVDR